MSKKRDMQRIIRAWKDETKATAIDMDKVARIDCIMHIRKKSASKLTFSGTTFMRLLAL